MSGPIWHQPQDTSPLCNRQLYSSVNGWLSVDSGGRNRSVTTFYLSLSLSLVQFWLIFSKFPRSVDVDFKLTSSTWPFFEPHLERAPLIFCVDFHLEFVNFKWTVFNDSFQRQLAVRSNPPCEVAKENWNREKTNTQFVLLEKRNSFTVLCFCFVRQF